MNLGTILAIIFVIAWVVKGLATVVNGEEPGQKKRPSRSLEDWDEMQAQRRAELSNEQASISQTSVDAAGPDTSQMTMAERIELARQRARQQAGLPPAVDEQAQEQAEALRRARAQAEQRARQERQAAQQRAQRERAQQQREARLKQQRRQQAQEQAEQQARQQRRSKQQRRQRPAQQPSAATTGTQRENVIAKSMQRIHQGHAHNTPAVTKLAKGPQPIGTNPAIGSMNRAALRKAFIMKELLDKPVALRDPQADLPS